MQFGSIYQNLKGNSPAGNIFLNVHWTHFAFQLKVGISFCTVLSSHCAFFTFRSWWLNLLGEHFLYTIWCKSQILVWLWSEVNKAKLNCLKYVWDMQIYVLVSSVFGENNVVLSDSNVKRTLRTFQLSSLFFTLFFFFFFMYDIFEDEFWRICLQIIWK